MTPYLSDAEEGRGRDFASLKKGRGKAIATVAPFFGDAQASQAAGGGSQLAGRGGARQ